jgi:hypothetical protein
VIGQIGLELDVIVGVIPEGSTTIIFVLFSVAADVRRL